tara:strand:- start:2622 stop:3434 length:813 start_codon:yes stop_codon:yes gene_type:complete
MTKIEGVQISHPDKILYPDLNVTKQDIANYYVKVADYILPFLKNRPLTLHRYPDGINSSGFYQKNAPDYFPDFIKTLSVPTQEGTNTQVYCNSKKSLIYLVNQGTIGFHVWLSQRDKLDKPDKIVFDLDPPHSQFSKVKEAALLIREYLKKKGENPHLMTTGQSGLHIYYKIRRTKTFDEVREEVKKMAKDIESQHPDLLTTETLKKNRDNKIFLDYLRNAYAQTSVCPYSLRPNPQAGVATPIEWEELDKIDSAQEYHLKNIIPRLKKS